MAFGVYIHIPYCLQRCTYCDFATYERSQIMPSASYIELVQEEIRQKSPVLEGRRLDTIYFGGGTPSLLPADEIVSLIQALEKAGSTFDKQTEITIEINPATVSQEKLKAYLNAGVNRFSVGAQTFDDRLLKMVHREHNAKQTLETLDLLLAHDVNFSFDLLFALPTQTLTGLRRDLEIALGRGAKHISPYCLTIPEGHVLSKNRPLEGEQIEMFEEIRSHLSGNGFERYEISNFAKPGFESRHNLLYWTDEDYLGLGLSAHSYLKRSEWGLRFWNPNSIGEYKSLIQSKSGEAWSEAPERHPPACMEKLEKHQSLTDFGHTALRLSRGLDPKTIERKFGPDAAHKTLARLESLREKGWVESFAGRWKLTSEGLVLSNRVFLEMTFLAEDLETPIH